MDKERFNKYLNEIIYIDETIQVKSIDEIINKLKVLFSNKVFLAHLKDAKNNWLNIPVDEVLENILKFLESYFFQKI